MKQYVVDESRPSDFDRIKAYLDEHHGADAMAGIYWIPVGERHLTDVQKAHAECRPFYFAVELEPHRLSCELLVRTRNCIRCDCIRYATAEQREWLIDHVDAILYALEIIT